MRDQSDNEVFDGVHGFAHGFGKAPYRCRRRNVLVCFDHAERIRIVDEDTKERLELRSADPAELAIAAIGTMRAMALTDALGSGEAVGELFQMLEKLKGVR